MSVIEQSGGAQGTAKAAVRSSARDGVQYHVDLGTLGFRVRELSGSERVSSPFRLEAKLFVGEDEELLDPERIIGSKAHVRVDRASEEVRRISGIVTEASINATAGGKPEVWVVIEPMLALARHKRDARVFVNRSVPQIVGEVLTDAHVKFELRLRDAYPPRPYCVQLRESDFDFVSRLLEDEGIFYTFLEDEEGTMILADAAAAYEPMIGLPALAFRPASGVERDIEVIHDLGRRARLAPSAVTLRDFNPDKPRLDMDVSAKGPCPSGVEFYDYPGKYALPSEGTRKAALIAAAMACASAKVRGASDCARLAPGRTFQLVDGPPNVPDGKYVVTSVAHRWRRDQDSFANELEALDAALTFRPERVTAAPVITNPLTGFVTGPEGADIHTDEMGRIKVRFPWDRRSLVDDTASHWIPVMQDNTGHSVGIPRVGWEVLVSFVEGDPDRPVVLGRVYNAADPFPELLPANKTVSALTSLSSPTRTGANMIRLEDKAGSEQIFIQAQKDQNVVVANDKTEKVMNTEFNTVSGDETLFVGNDQKVTVDVDRSLTVTGNQSLAVGGSRRRKVGADDKDDVSGDRSLTIGGKHFRKIEGYDSVRVKKLKEKVGGLDLEASIKANQTSAGMAMTLTVGGAMVELTAKDKEESCKLLRAETVGGLVFTKAGIDVKVGAQGRSTTIGGALAVTAGGPLLLKGVSGLTADALLGLVEGTESLTLVAGNTVVALKGDEISITTDQSIKLESRGESALAADVANLNKP